ncbi:hypothetical protein ABDI30_02690 [Paenibacillus cisolokensis]|uniref:S8 family serine peptidase n=1 Tax=Paenibacillus cisolokensis TaxID=1658519 RepID=UPI003D2DDC25
MCWGSCSIGCTVNTLTASSLLTFAHELVVRFAEGITQEQIDAIHKKARCEVVETSEDLGYTRIKSKRSMRRLLKHYNKLKEIEYAEPILALAQAPRRKRFKMYAWDRGVVVIAAAGNENTNAPRGRSGDMAGSMLPGQCTCPHPRPSLA